MRDDFSAATKELLATRAGHRCSNPDCLQPTSGPQDNSAGVTNIGVASHIMAASPDGPRYDASLTTDQRRSKDNGIWLCQNHGKLVDNDAGRFSVEVLREWKRLAEHRARLELEAPRSVSERASPTLTGFGRDTPNPVRCMGAPPTAPGELPRFYELDPLRFQGLCRDLYQVDPAFATAEVYGTPGQRQRGVDIVAIRRDGTGLGVGQCKCVEPDSLGPALLVRASDEFFDHLDSWRDRAVGKFILFVAPDTSDTKIQEESLRQRGRFHAAAIEYELWGEAVITNKLRSEPGITRTYLGEDWKEILCGTGVSRFPQESLVIDSILRTQLETLTGHVADAADREVELLRIAWRSGRRTEAQTGIKRLCEPSRWQAFPVELKAKVLRFEAQLALEAEDLPKARSLADEAGRFDPTANHRLLALIARAEGRPDEALALVQTATDPESITLRGALIMECGNVPAALSVLEEAGDRAEAHRLRALGFALQHDLARARLEAEKAAELEPGWHAITYTRLVVNYLSGLSPAVLPVRLPQWPEPEEWSFVKTDDESREFFRSAVSLAAQLEKEAGSDVEEQRVYTAWHAAGLANDPERRDSASQYCREVLTRDPGNFRVLAWAMARRLDVDLESSAGVLRERVDAGHASPPEVIALLALHLQAGDVGAAKALLENTRSLLAESAGDALWQFWMTQVAPAETEDAQTARPILGGPVELDEALLAGLRGRARVAGDPAPLITELQARHEAGNVRATFELCSVLASIGKWDEAAPLTNAVVEKVKTAEALNLACVVLYNARQFEAALRLLDRHRSLFPRSELPTQMQRLRLASQRELGLLPAATAEAADLFSREPSKSHFLVLADLYFEKGDLSALASLIGKHDRFEDFTTRELLRLAMRVSDVERTVATELWHRAESQGFADVDIPAALEVGYKLGLDRQLRGILQRFGELAARPEGYVRSMNFDEVRDLLMARRDDVERVYAMYRAGSIPVHLVSQHLKRPLVWWYRRSPLHNAAAGRSVTGGTFTRRGWRVGSSIKLDPTIPIRLHADLTALFMAAHFRVLGRIETAFRPIMLPHRAVVALISIRSALTPIQPVRLQALRDVNQLVSDQTIRVLEIDHSTCLPDELASIDSHAARLLRYAQTEGWLFADHLPIRGNSFQGDLPTIPPDYKSTLTTVHSIVTALAGLGELSDAERQSALESLGPEHVSPSRVDIDRGTTLLCSANILELLAQGGALERAAQVFRLCIDKRDLDIFVVNEITAGNQADEDVRWVTELIDRVGRGIDSGLYEVLPDLEHPDNHMSAAADDSPTVRCLLDLLRFSPSDGAVIWADDRWITGFVHRDGVPVVDTLDVLYALRDRAALSDEELLQILHEIRDGDFRLFALDQIEIQAWTKRGQITDGALVETRELRTIRRYYARSVAESEMLGVQSGEQSGSNEWPYLLNSGMAVVNAIVELWGNEQAPPAAAGPRAEWVLKNLYIPDRGRAFTRAERTLDVDRHFEAIGLSGLLSHALTLSDDRVSESRRRYFRWIYERLLRRRFDADPLLATTTLDVLKASLTLSVGRPEDTAQHRRLALALIRNLVADMPDEIRGRLAEDGDFLANLSITRERVMRIADHQVKAEEFWRLAAAVFRSGADAIFVSGQNQLTVKILDEASGRKLIVEDSIARMQYLLLPEGLGILSDSPAEREAALDTMSQFFDLPAGARLSAVARVAGLDNPAERVFEVAQLRKNSAVNDYADLEQKVNAGNQPVDERDFIPDDVEPLIRHLRLNSASAGSEEIGAQLRNATTILIDEIGLEDGIVRLSGLPIALSALIVSSMAALSVDGRSALLKRLVRRIGTSPIGAAHLARLFLEFAADRPSHVRFVRAVMRAQVTKAGAVPRAAWLAVLRYCGNELMSLESFRQLPAAIRLCLVWSHGDRLFRILRNGRVAEGWILNYFANAVRRLPVEVVFGDQAYCLDIAYPRRVASLPFALAAVAYASEHGQFVDEAARELFAKQIESEPAEAIDLVGDAVSSPDALGTILRHDGRPAWLSVLTPALRERFSAETLRSQLSAAMDAIRSGEGGISAWAVIHAVLRDYPIAQELKPVVREMAVATDFSRLFTDSVQATLLAITFAAQHASDLGADVVDRVREEVVAVAVAAADRRDLEPEQRDQVQQVLLSATIYLYARKTGTDEPSRFADIASLLEVLVKKWPQLVEQAQVFVDNLVEALPNADSRWLWQLQVELRAMR